MSHNTLLQEVRFTVKERNIVLDVSIYDNSDPHELAHTYALQSITPSHKATDAESQPRDNQLDAQLYEKVYLTVYDMVVEAQTKANAAIPPRPPLPPLEKAMKKQHDALPEPSRSMLLQKPSEQPSQRRTGGNPPVDVPRYDIVPFTKKKKRNWVVTITWEERPIQKRMDNDQEWTERKRTIRQEGKILQLMSSMEQELVQDRKNHGFETQHVFIVRMYYRHATDSGLPPLIDHLRNI